MRMNFKPVMLTVSVLSLGLLLNEVASAEDLIFEGQKADAEAADFLASSSKTKRTERAIEAVETMIAQAKARASRETVATLDDKGAAGKIASEDEIQRVWAALEAAQSKIQDLENRTDASPFTPPKSLGWSEGDAIDPVQSAYPIAKGESLRLAQVHFNANSAELSPGSKRLALEAAEWIKTLPNKKIIVAGYSDTVGPADANRAMSEKRASVVAAVLEEAGIDPSSMKVVGYGEQGIPEATGDEVAEPLNRCVGIIVVPDDQPS